VTQDESSLVGYKIFGASGIAYVFPSNSGIVWNPLAATERLEGLYNTPPPESTSLRDVQAPFFQKGSVTCCCSGKWHAHIEPSRCGVGVL